MKISTPEECAAAKQKAIDMLADGARLKILTEQHFLGTLSPDEQAEYDALLLEWMALDKAVRAYLDSDARR